MDWVRRSTSNERQPACLVHRIHAHAVVRLHAMRICCLAKRGATARPSATVDCDLGLHGAPASPPPHRPLPLEA